MISLKTFNNIELNLRILPSLPYEVESIIEILKCILWVFSKLVIDSFLILEAGKKKDIVTYFSLTFSKDSVIVCYRIIIPREKHKAITLIFYFIQDQLVTLVLYNSLIVHLTLLHFSQISGGIFLLADIVNHTLFVYLGSNVSILNFNYVFFQIDIKVAVCYHKWV